PRRPDRQYDPYEVIRWLKDQRRGGLGDPAQGVGASTAKTDREDYQAKFERLKYEKLADLVIPKADARKKYLTLVVQIRAALLAQSEAIAPQLAHLGAREAGRVLDARMRWVCHQFERGWLPLPPAMLVEMDAMVERYAVDILATAGDEDPVVVAESGDGE
ncbi:MAG: hypothetical protein H0W83_07815, partial [Planctomycetes bacterium]|nr:hypothetical protein [Planctomycetota bacterium]